ncbi:MAG: nucleoside hydrolase [Bacteroidota bacterium]
MLQKTDGYVRALLLLYALGLLVSCSQESDAPHANTGSPRSVLVDTDMGLDDMRAIMALLADTSLEVNGIMTIEGSATLGEGTDNLIGMLETHHIGSVPVIAGTEYPDLPDPAWRVSANTLLGERFPPPREISPSTLSNEWIDRQGKMRDIVAIGPLGNLARIFDPAHRRLTSRARVWIPARVKGDVVADWNLSYDEQATRSIFESGRAIFIVDVPPISPEETHSLLSSVKGNTTAAEWIREVSSRGIANGHEMQLFDEFVVVGLTSPDLITVSDESYAVRFAADGTLRLQQDTEGNIRLVKISDIDRALTTLKALWERGPISDHRIQHKTVIPPEEYLRAFHGHLGPYVVLGYRMGSEALVELRSDGHFGLSAEVHSILKPPQSCLIDGVQLGSGCTLGKRNISIRANKGAAWALFTSENGETITIRLRSEIPGLVADLVRSRGVEAAGREMLARSTDELFSKNAGH